MGLDVLWSLTVEHPPGTRAGSHTTEEKETIDTKHLVVFWNKRSGEVLSDFILKDECFYHAAPQHTSAGSFAILPV